MSAPHRATSATSPSGRGSTAAKPAKSSAPSTVPAALHSTRDTRGPRSGLTRKTAVAGSQYQWVSPAVPLGVVEGLRDGGTGPEGERDPQPVLTAARAEPGAQQVPHAVPAGVQVTAAALVEGVGGVQQGVVEGAQRGGGPGGRGQRPGVGVLPDGGGEPPGPGRRPFGQRLRGPGEGRRGLGEGQGGGVLGVQPPFGGGTGVTPQPRSGEGVLGVVEGRGERGAAGGGVLGPRRVEQVRDGVVHPGHRVPFTVEPEVAGHRAGRGQDEPQREQPSGPGEEGEGARPPGLRDRHPGADRRGDEQLRAAAGRDRPDGAHPAA